MRYTSLFLVLTLGGAGPAFAETTLHLSDTETVMAHPDLLVASIQAVASAPTAAAAQQQVNSAVAAALARAKQVPAVTVSTQQYSSWQPKEHGAWQASQTVTLSSRDGAALLTLTGELQANGLAVNELNWQLSPEASRKAHDEALRQAISQLRARADDAAGLLGLRFESFQRVSIASPEVFPAPRVMGAMMAAASPAPPNAVAQDMPVTATAEADALLGD